MLTGRRGDQAMIIENREDQAMSIAWYGWVATPLTCNGFLNNHQTTIHEGQ